MNDSFARPNRRCFLISFKRVVLPVLVLYGVASLALGVAAQGQACAAPVRIMPLGDSITDSSPNYNSYRRPLWHALQDARYCVDFVGGRQGDMENRPPPDPDFDVDHEGRGGWRVDMVLNDVTGWLETGQPDIVLVMLGTNDIIQGQSVDSTLDELEQLVAILRENNPEMVILLAQVPPMTWVAYERIPELNAGIAELAERVTTAESPVIAVDHYTGFDGNVDTRDGVHPTEAAERKQAERWFEALVTVLENQDDAEATAETRTDTRGE